MQNASSAFLALRRLFLVLYEAVHTQPEKCPKAAFLGIVFREQLSLEQPGKEALGQVLGILKPAIPSKADVLENLLARGL